jgi:hypothetical protein
VKKFKSLVLVLLMCVMLSSCTSHTQYGECVGLFDEHEINLRYGVSAWNVIMAFIFSETVIVPVVVVLTELECPVGKYSDK